MRFASAVLARRSRWCSDARRWVPGPRQGREGAGHAEQARRPGEMQQGRPRRPGGQMGRRRRVQLQRRWQHSRFQHHAAEKMHFYV